MAIDLNKRAEKVGIILTKKSLPKPPVMRVGVMMDVSKSIDWQYFNGTMHETFCRVMGMAVKFDDNGEMDAWSFDDAVTQLGVATAANFETFVKKEILDNPLISKWNGTMYGPPINAAMNRYFLGESVTKGGVLGFFGKTKHVLPSDISIPAYGLLITDGQNFDEPQTEKLLVDSQKYPIYWQMVGVGNPQSFKFLKRMADKYPNVGFLHLNDLKLSDDELYENLISDELVAWLKKHQ